jgi:nucleoside 2-deoxyribosyltransferase
MDSPLVYVAGPLFDDGERWFIEQVEAVVAGIGLDTFLPHRDNVDKTPTTVGQIFDNNRSALDRADLVVANLNGITTDDGTAWELGYAFARGTYAIGLHTDWRSRFTDEVVNLMMERSLNEIARSLDELEHRVRAWQQA